MLKLKLLIDEQRRKLDWNIASRDWNSVAENAAMLNALEKLSKLVDEKSINDICDDIDLSEDKEILSDEEIFMITETDEKE